MTVRPHARDTTRDPALSLRGVVVRRSGKVVLDVPALDVERGEVLAIIGPNGAGKSTLLRVLGIVQAPDAGEVRVGGRRVDVSSGLAARRRIVTMLQEPHLADMSVADNVALGLRFRGSPRRHRTARVQRALERLSIAQLAPRSARTLSGGEAQRCALARALVLEPDVLLLDEPFASVDQPARETLLAELGAIIRRDRLTTVVVTHERWEARALADRLAVLMDGRLVQVGSAESVFQAPISDAVAQFVGVETIADGRVERVSGGIAVVDLAGHKIEVAADAVPGQHVRICLRPEDVTLVSGDVPPPLSSARNRVSGRVAQVTAAGRDVRVIVDCGVPIVALVTRRSADELGLTEGAAITAVFKATAPHLITRDRLLDNVFGR